MWRFSCYKTFHMTNFHIYDKNFQTYSNFLSWAGFEHTYVHVVIVMLIFYSVHFMCELYYASRASV